mgnify:CR=1 FL=1
MKSKIAFCCTAAFTIAVFCAATIMTFLYTPRTLLAYIPAQNRTDLTAAMSTRSPEDYPDIVRTYERTFSEETLVITFSCPGELPPFLTWNIPCFVTEDPEMTGIRIEGYVTSNLVDKAKAAELWQIETVYEKGRICFIGGKPEVTVHTMEFCTDLSRTPQTSFLTPSLSAGYALKILCGRGCTADVQYSRPSEEV